MALRRIWRGMQRFFRAVFLPGRPDPLADLDEAFAPIDVDEVKKQLRLIEDAARFGKNELPAADDTGLDGPQLRVQQYVQDEVAAAFRRANKELQRLRDAMSARDVEPLVERAETLPGDVVRAVRVASREATRRIHEIKTQLADYQRSIDRYRDRYGLERGPRLKGPDERRSIMAGVIILALFQAIINSFFFSQGMVYGLSAGLVFAFLLGIADILLHVMLGRQAVKVVAPDLANRILGVATFVFTLITVSVWNLGLVHLRNVIRRMGFTNGMEVWWSSVTTEPFGFTDFGSFALLAMGSICSILAAATGWGWNEPIPILREAAGKIEQLKDDLEYWQEREVTAGYEERAEAEATLEKVQGQVAHNVQMAEAIFGQTDRLVKNLSTFVAEAERAYKALIQAYRDENRVARTTSPPAYFRKEPALKIEIPLEFDLGVMESALNRQKELRATLVSRSRELRERIVEAPVDEMESKVEA